MSPTSATKTENQNTPIQLLFLNIYRKFHSRFHSEIKKTKILVVVGASLFSIWVAPRVAPRFAPENCTKLKIIPFLDMYVFIRFH